MRTALVLLTCLALALSACKDEPKKAIGGTAQGEILPGSTSDAMLPFDTVKSQAPLAPRAEAGDKADAKPGERKADASGAAEEEVPAEAKAPAAVEEPAGE